MPWGWGWGRLQKTGLIARSRFIIYIIFYFGCCSYRFVNSLESLHLSNFFFQFVSDLLGLRGFTRSFDKVNQTLNYANGPLYVNECTFRGRESFVFFPFFFFFLPPL